MKKAVIWVTLIGAGITVIVMFFMSGSSTSSTAGSEGRVVNQTQVQGESFTLNPGQGRVVKTSYKRVVWKTAGGQAMVRERDQAWYGEWKRDLPGRQTRFEFSEADAIEFWVPKNFPNPVTIVINQS